MLPPGMQTHAIMKGNPMKLHFLPCLAVILLVLLALFLKFCVPGYSFSALVCCALAGIVTFYEVTRLLGPHCPAFIHILQTVFTVCLALGILVAAVTEAIIIHASFGDPEEDVDYVVVLGAKVREDGPSMSLWDRISAAAAYLEAHPDVTAVVSGGKGADEPMTEAEAMYIHLVDLGIDPKRILREDKATSTWENLNYSLDLIEKTTGQRPNKIGVLSSEYHLFRASLFAKRCGVEFVGIPARTSRPGQTVNHFLREIAGVWHYLILGGNYD